MGNNLTEAIERKINPAVMAGTKLSQRGPGVPLFQNMTELGEFAKLLAVADIAIRPQFRNNVGACMAVCMQAQRWQMDPIAVANKSFVVNDQLAYESQLIVAVINTRAPIKGRLKTRFVGEGQKRKCVAWATFEGDDEPTEVESPEIGNIKPQNSPLWKTDPDQQLAYYTKRAWARREIPELMLGVYDPEEMQDMSLQGAAGVMKDVSPQPVERMKRSDFTDQAKVIEAQAEAEQQQDAKADQTIEDPSYFWDGAGLGVAVPVENGRADFAEWANRIVQLAQTLTGMARPDRLDLLKKLLDDNARPRDQFARVSPAGAQDLNDAFARIAIELNTGVVEEPKKTAERETRAEPEIRATVVTFWTGDSLAIAVPNKGKDLRAWDAEMRKAIPNAPTLELLTKLDTDNAATMRRWALANPPATNELRQAIRGRAEELMGSDSGDDGNGQEAGAQDSASGEGQDGADE